MPIRLISQLQCILLRGSSELKQAMSLQSKSNRLALPLVVSTCNGLEGSTSPSCERSAEHSVRCVDSRCAVSSTDAVASLSSAVSARSASRLRTTKSSSTCGTKHRLPSIRKIVLKAPCHQLPLMSLRGHLYSSKARLRIIKLLRQRHGIARDIAQLAKAVASRHG